MIKSRYYKPGQLFTYKDKVYRISKQFSIWDTNTCEKCREYNGVLPCKEDPTFPCTKYCGMESFPKLVTLCKNE